MCWTGAPGLYAVCILDHMKIPMSTYRDSMRVNVCRDWAVEVSSSCSGGGDLF